MIKIQQLYEEQTKMHTGIDKIQISSQHTHIGLEFKKKCNLRKLFSLKNEINY